MSQQSITEKCGSKCSTAAKRSGCRSLKALRLSATASSETRPVLIRPLSKLEKVVQVKSFLLFRSSSKFRGQRMLTNCGGTRLCQSFRTELTTESVMTSGEYAQAHTMMSTVRVSKPLVAVGVRSTREPRLSRTSEIKASKEDSLKLGSVRCTNI